MIAVRASLRALGPLLALITLHVLPAIAAILQFGLYPLWAFGAVLFSLGLQCLIQSSASPKQRRPWRIFAAVLSALLAIASTSLYTSFLFQGSGFNVQFFLHFDLQSLRVGLGEFLPLILFNSFYIALCAAVAYFLRPLETSKTAGFGSAAVAIVLAYFTLGPITSVKEYRAELAEQIEISQRSVMRNRPPAEVEPLSRTPKNIVLIYAEGLETTYMDGALFPGLMPRLTALRERAVSFTNAHQVMNTKWTIAGLVASQCSVPFNVGKIYGEANVGLASVDIPFGNEVCLGDIAKAYGYNTTFMGGAGLAFAGKGKFLAAHGFDNLLGRTALSKRQPDKSYVSGWGLYDDELMRFAHNEIEALSQADAPFLLSVLTLDTHQPEGHPSKSCKPYLAEDNPMLQAVHCSDQIISAFLEKQLASEAAKDTVYVLFSDHLSNRNTVYDTLLAQGDTRRLSFMAWGPDLKPMSVDPPLTHFDVAPTVIEWAGLPNYRNHNWGRSVASGRAGLWFAGDAEAQAAAEDVSYINDTGGYDDITVTLDPIEVQVGEQIFKASYAGGELRHRIYVVLFDDGGDVESIGFYGSKKYLDQAKVDNFYIALSGHPSIGGFSENEAEEHSEGTLYYTMGRNGRDDFVSGMIEEKLEISAQELEALIKTTSKP